MATLAASPRRILTAEEKKARDAGYKVDVREFTLVLKKLTKIFDQLVALNTALSQGGKGTYLAFPDPENPQTRIIFNRRHMKSANARFRKAIEGLKNYLRVSKKKTRDPVKPESFSGTFTPVFAGDALRAYFTIAPEIFGPLSPKQAVATQQAGEALMNSLPMATQGYLLRNTCTLLFYIHAHASNLQAEDNAQFARSDEVMMQAFGGDIPAAFFSYRGPDGKPIKLPMTDAVQQGYIPQAENTYQVVTRLYPPGTLNKKNPPQDVGFRPGRFNTYYYQNIAAANYYSKTALLANNALAAAAEALARDDVRQAMLQEHSIVKQVSEEWRDILEPGRKVLRDARKKANDARKKANNAQ